MICQWYRSIWFFLSQWLTWYDPRYSKIATSFSTIHTYQVDLECPFKAMAGADTSIVDDYVNTTEPPRRHIEHSYWNMVIYNASRTVCTWFYCVLFILLSFLVVWWDPFANILYRCFIGFQGCPRATEVNWNDMSKMDVTQPQQNTRKRKLSAYFLGCTIKCNV